jgi:hypothetical protein
MKQRISQAISAHMPFERPTTGLQIVSAAIQSIWKENGTGIMVA